MKLFRVAFKVRPTADHPRYWDWDFGLLSIWLFASGDDDAEGRAEEIVRQLPFELASESDYRTSEPADTAPAHSEAQKEFAATNPALHSGLALFLDAGATGIDEPKGFED